MESNSESPIIIQMLKNVKLIIELSKARDCWSLEELEVINITYKNVCEISQQLQAKQTQEKEKVLEYTTDDPVLEDHEPELDESLEEIN